MAQARRKGSRSARKQKGTSSHGFGMFVAGLVVGAVAASFFIGLRSDDPESIGRGIEHMITASKSRFAADVETTPPAPEKKRSTEFDFYMLLPEIEHVVPDNESPPEPVSESSADKSPPAQAATASPRVVEPPAATAKPDDSGAARFELQAGAFVRMADADRLKAELALKGLSSRIQKVSIEGRGDFYRVRLGPYSSTAELESVDRQLAGLGIDALRLKLSGG